MTGPELAAIRKHLGLTAWVFGRALGYEHATRNAVESHMWQIERREHVPGPVARLAALYERWPELIHS